MTETDDPIEHEKTVSVSPEDQSSDRVQSDADQAETVGLIAANSDQRDADQETTVGLLQGIAESVEQSGRSNADWADSVARNDEDRAQSDADQGVTVALLQGLTDLMPDVAQLSVSVPVLIESNEALREAALTGMEREATSKQRYRVTIAVLASIIALGLITGVILYGLVLSNLHSANKGRAQIRDCIQPTGSCKKAGDAAMLRAVTTINETAVAAALCNRTLPRSATDTTFRLCVSSKIRTK